MMFPLVRDLAAEGIAVRLTCGVLGFSSQAFYKWRSRPCSDRDWYDAHLTNAIVDVHGDACCSFHDGCCSTGAEEGSSAGLSIYSARASRRPKADAGRALGEDSAGAGFHPWRLSI